MRYPFGAFKNSSNVFRRHRYPEFNGYPYTFHQDRWQTTEITIFVETEAGIVVTNSLGTWNLHITPDPAEGEYGTLQVPTADGQTTISIEDGYYGYDIQMLKINNSVLYDTRIL